MNTQPYKLITTEDGTTSLYSYEYSQAMHSTSGAYQEALLKHVNPSGILNSDQDKLLVLDIGFGIGYNILALLVEFLSKKSAQNLSIISLENSVKHKQVMDTIFFNDERDIIYNDIRNCLSSGTAERGSYSIRLLKGDARESVKTMKGIMFDTVFHDPYSPSKNPELWSVEFFIELYRLMNETAVLTTYSSASQIRMAMIEAGFIIGKGPSVGKKREGTLACKTGKGNRPELSKDELSALKADPGSIPYRDYELKDKREVILNRRIEAVRALRKRDSDQVIKFIKD